MKTTHDDLAGLLEESRARMLGLLGPLDLQTMTRQVDPIMSPLVWDLAHVGNYEHQWALGQLAGHPTDPVLDDLYNAFEHPRWERPALPLLGPSEARRYIAEVRGKVLDLLPHVDIENTAKPLTNDGFVFAMVAQHEHMHVETVLATLALLRGQGFQATPAPPPDRAPSPPARSEVPLGGEAVRVGTSTYAWAYDNEKPAHIVTLAPYAIATAPVTNAQYAEFVADGGYDDSRLWSTAGWAWLRGAKASAPLYWERDGAGGWLRDRFGTREALHPREPVMHVCWYEADAYCRWAGRRLPSEAEWEHAARGASLEQANLATTLDGPFGPTPVGSYPDGASTSGCHQMLGDVWEWTSTSFGAYPGFAAFPYKEYSEVFFGDEYKVLRGGSWATHPTASRATFRNWDLPQRRQVFSGFRTARSL